MLWAPIMLLIALEWKMTFSFFFCFVFSEEIKKKKKKSWLKKTAESAQGMRQSRLIIHCHWNLIYSRSLGRSGNVTTLRETRLQLTFSELTSHERHINKNTIIASQLLSKMKISPQQCMQCEKLRSLVLLHFYLSSDRSILRHWLNKVSYLKQGGGKEGGSVKPWISSGSYLTVQTQIALFICISPWVNLGGQRKMTSTWGSVIMLL